VGLFVGGRRWLGRWGGPAAVGLYCSSGAALAFAWRDYMPTFTDASLVAAGTGLLLWATLATQASAPRRTWVGLSGFVALEAATFVRYTDVVILGCAVLAVCVGWRRRPTGPPTAAVLWWLGSVAAFGLGVIAFDTAVYGGPLTTGYPSGEVTFSLQAVGPNVREMPVHLVQAMPMALLALMSVVWILVRRVAAGRQAHLASSPVARDLCVGLALTASWVAIWAVYSAYTWTTDPTSVTVQVVRFYLPAMGAISLLGAWAVTRIPQRGWMPGVISAAIVAVFFVLGISEFHAMYAAFGVPLNR
jgi:hypothetical protein